ncbi:MAG TPA: tyrosine-type recombinase/integrase [Syntrophales bacterium]|nr:tyrosine-type recombinase/integrase [Syntrophales bacterium]HQN77978.1 tyrosine-type recombinase/integrase [Syntrophales bacterium]HQQ26850.1 tyrosine-type recombinase/integrase [Syntrophales bacterium]
MACVTKRNGRYVIDCYDQYGQRYRKTLPKGTTKEEARGLLQEIEKKISRRTFLHEKKVPAFGEVAAEWLEFKKPQVRIGTWSAYEGQIKNHFHEWLDKRIAVITTADVERFITRKQKLKMNLSSLRKLLITMNQIFAYAVRHRTIDSNPVRDAEKPRRSEDLMEARKKINILTPEEINGLMEAEEDPKFRLLYLFAVMTGTRQGEILGLKWSDVDFKEKQVHIRRTFNHGRYFEPKSKDSVRRIDLSPIVVKELAKWKLQSGANEADLVFPSDAGTPIDCSHLHGRHFKPALKKAGLPKTTRFHDLRHFYASLMLSQGENIKYVQSQLGHSSPMVTLQVYAHLLRPSNQEAVTRLEKTVFKKSGQNLVTEKNEGVTESP